jgi:hypothetical protein
MFCSKCGCQLNNSSIFCHSCGNRIASETPAAYDAVPVVSEGVAPGQASLFPENEPVAEPNAGDTAISGSTEAPEPIAPVEVSASASADHPGNFDANPPQEENKKEKLNFGVPALVFCLAVIGLLSVACGVLSALYFF